MGEALKEVACSCFLGWGKSAIAKRLRLVDEEGGGNCMYIMVDFATNTINTILSKFIWYPSESTVQYFTPLSMPKVNLPR